MNLDYFDETLAEFFKLKEKTKVMKERLEELKKEISGALHAKGESIIKCPNFSAVMKHRNPNRAWQVEDMRKALGDDFFPEFERECKKAKGPLVEVISVTENKMKKNSVA
tara:strand:- start:893 stop:1222 length:330 start_codon:yes stop_codon:yes gene_type:complete